MSEAALESLRRSTRNTLLLTDVVVGVLPLVLVVRSGLGTVRLALLVPAVAVLLVLHVHSILRAVRGPWLAFPLGRTYALAALAIAVTCVMASAEAPGGALGSLYTGLAVSEFVIARESRSARRHIGTAVVVHVSALVTTVVLTGQSAELGNAVIFSVILVLFVGYGVGVAYRQWEAALKLEEARRTAAELATTRERLRLAEDLHDILGHALEVVSLKSELAVRLDDPVKSKNEMTEVQRLARNALRDVRALAHGNRPTDLAVELAGAQKLLDSAGIACDFNADPAELSQNERELFGRVLREAMTNALRHADPRNCAVGLTVQSDQVVLKVLNDGAAPIDSDGEGSGLAGLARRIKEADGEFTARAVEPASFEVIASLPR